MKTKTFATLLFCLLSASTVSAAEISPLLLYPPDGDTRAERLVEVTVRLKAPPTATTLEALNKLGVIAESSPGRLAVVGRVLSMQLNYDQLKSLAALPEVERVEPAKPLVKIRPLIDTTAEIEAAQAWRQAIGDQSICGQGVTLADHEGGWDIYHPDFFRPDGGVFSFEDVNGDGRAGAGDRVDLDGDGNAESTLSLLNTYQYNGYTSNTTQPAGYQPDIDWLYIDSNNNNQRDHGSADGFSDASPALGEPIFVADDVDGDGRISVDEKLLLLDTPKVMAIDVEGTRYERGVNLSQYAWGVEDPGHGTGALGVAAAGWPGLRRYTGVAPCADLVLIKRDDPVQALAVAQELDVDVIFYEWDLPTEIQDGSTNFELAAIDAAAAGMVQVTACGNLANADHVMKVTPAPGTTETVRFSTDGYGYYNYSAGWFNIYWDGPMDHVELVLERNGDTMDLMAGGGSQTSGQVDGEWVGAWRQTSARGVSQVMMVLGGSGILANEVYSLHVTIKPGASVSQVRGIVFDDQSGWGKGISWLDALTDEGSALMPSTGDAMIGVAAYGGNNDLSPWGWGDVGERRAYSGVGPRIDGMQQVDIAGPDDPYAPAREAGGPYGNYHTFGGTSGALPHVAGVATLLRQADPSLSTAELTQRLYDYAEVDGFVGTVPNEQLGWGKVRAWSSIYEGAAIPEAPSVELDTTPLVVGQASNLRAVATDPDSPADSLILAWDIGYDGSVEQESDAQSMSLTPTELGEILVYIQVSDEDGMIGRTLGRVPVIEDCATAGCEEGCCGEDGLCGECPVEPEDIAEVSDISEAEDISDVLEQEDMSSDVLEQDDYGSDAQAEDLSEATDDSLLDPGTDSQSQEDTLDGTTAELLEQADGGSSDDCACTLHRRPAPMSTPLVLLFVGLFFWLKSRHED